METFRESFLSKPRPSLSSGPPDECRAREFFQTQTLPALCFIFPSELWQQSVLSVAYSDPAIMCLVAATGAYHRSMHIAGADAWRQLDFTHTTPDPIMLYGIKKHAEAARLLRESISSKAPQMRIIKLACIIFTILEFLRGSRVTATSHLMSGMSLLEENNTLLRIDPFETEVDATLSRLSLVQSLYGRPRSSPFPAIQAVPVPENLIHTIPFSNIQEARRSMINLSSLVFLFVRKVERNYTAPQTPALLAEQETLSSQLLCWSNKVEQLERDKPGEVDRRGMIVLRVLHATAFIFLKTITTLYQTSFDQYTSMFRSIVETLEPLLDELRCSSEGAALFSLDLAIIPCLFYTAIKCRDPELRRKAVSLLNKAPQREGLWDAREASIVAEHTIEFEERNLHHDEVEKCCYIPEEDRAQDVDIREVMADGEKASLCVVFRWRPYATYQGLAEKFVYIK